MNSIHGDMSRQLYQPLRLSLQNSHHRAHPFRVTEHARRRRGALPEQAPLSLTEIAGRITLRPTGGAKTRSGWHG